MKGEKVWQEFFASDGKYADRDEPGKDGCNQGGGNVAAAGYIEGNRKQAGPEKAAGVLEGHPAAAAAADEALVIIHQAADGGKGHVWVAETIPNSTSASCRWKGTGQMLIFQTALAGDVFSGPLLPFVLT